MSFSGRIKTISAFTVSLPILCALNTDVKAWEQSYPRSPVQSSDADVDADKPVIRVIIPNLPDPKALEPASSVSLTNVFERRTIGYPVQHGAELGLAWDFLVNQKGFSKCIDFVSTNDNKYQTADVRVQQITDEDILDITLNTSFSASASGSIEIFKASAETSMTLNASHHMASNDISFIAHASITSGIINVSPAEGVSLKGVTLLPDMAKLASTNPTIFRDKCGDGFVASIGSGADLYISFHFHELTVKDRLELEYSAKASGGFGDVLSASGSSSLRTTIEKFSRDSKLTVNFIQQGGIIETIPITLEAAREKVQGLAKEEKNGPKPMYITLVPYSELSNWPGYYLVDTSDVRQRAVRYAQRLKSIYFEVMNIRENYLREREGDEGKLINDKYFYFYRHQLRIEDLSQVAQLVLDEMAIVAEILKQLDSPECSPKAISTHIAPQPTWKARKTAMVAWKSSIEALTADSNKCNDEVEAKIKSAEHFNDYRFWLKLPVPVNALSDQMLSNLQNKATSDADRKNDYAQALFRHWIERQEQIRCRLFFECLTLKSKSELYDLIVADIIPISLANPPQGFKVIAKAKICIGQYAWRCAAGYTHAYNCDRQNDDANAKDYCLVQRPGFSYSWKRDSTYGGNRCGYSNDTFTCYGFQPQFP